MKQFSSAQLNKMSREDLVAMVLQMQQQNHALTEKLSLMQVRFFGRSTEKLSTLPGQMKLFNEAESVAAEVVAEPTIEQAVVRKKKQKGQRQVDLSQLPVRKEQHELTEQQLTEIYGEGGWERLPDEVFSRVEYTPCCPGSGRAPRGRLCRQKRGTHYPCKPAGGFAAHNSIATPSLVAAIMNAKYTKAIPLYRIAQEFERNDFKLSRAAMGNWVIRCAERYLSLVYDRLRSYLCQQKVLQVDETTCQVTKDGRASNTKSYMFVYRTSELSLVHPVILYDYQTTRSSKHVYKFLKGFSGILESDAFSGYKSLDRREASIQAAFCWAHARRDYADALKALKGDAKKAAAESIANQALVHIAGIYKAEAALKDLPAEDRLVRRHKEVLPLVEAYFAWVHEQEPASIISEKTRSGLQYSVNQESYLKVFLENGEVPIDNSATERAIRPFTVGRANWHIIDTVHGAQASAMIYSLVETAKANHLKIYEYLKYLLTEIPKHMDDCKLNFVEDLLPWSKSLPQECHKSI